MTDRARTSAYDALSATWTGTTFHKSRRINASERDDVIRTILTKEIGLVGVKAYALERAYST